MSRTLWDMSRGQSARLDGFAADIDARYRVRLTELGFHPGQQVVCMVAPALGAPKVYRLSNSVFSLEDRVARQVLVNGTGA